MNDIVVGPRPATVWFQPDGRPVPSSLPAGSEWWEDYRGALRNRVAVAVRRGEVAVLARQRPIELRKRLPVDGVLVRRLRPAAPRWRKPAIIAAAIVVPLAAVIAAVVYVLAGMVAFVAEHPIAIGVGALVFLLGAGSIAGAVGGPGCPGIHCGGCKR